MTFGAASWVDWNLEWPSNQTLKQLRRGSDGGTATPCLAMAAEVRFCCKEAVLHRTAACFYLLLSLVVKMTPESLETQRCSGSPGVCCFWHRSWRCCCHPLVLHRSCCAEEPGKLTGGFRDTEECKEKHSSHLRCCLYFCLSLWSGIIHG